MEFEVPVRPPVPLRPIVAVMVCGPGLINVTEKIPVPPVRVGLTGRIALLSVLLNCIDPPNIVTTRLAPSSALTVKVIGVPATSEAGAETDN